MIARFYREGFLMQIVQWIISEPASLSGDFSSLLCEDISPLPDPEGFFIHLFFALQNPRDSYIMLNILDHQYIAEELYWK